MSEAKIRCEMFSETNFNDLDKEINNFLNDEDIEFVDIKFSTCMVEDCIFYSAIVVYKI
jgi:hypothetical protein